MLVRFQRLLERALRLSARYPEMSREQRRTLSGQRKSDSKRQGLFNRPIGPKRRRALCLLSNKLMDQFWQRSTLVRKTGEFTFRIVRIGPASVFRFHSWNSTILLARTTVIIYLRPNRNDSGHVLITTINIDLGHSWTIMGWTIWSDCKNGAVPSPVLSLKSRSPSSDAS
jgi:hypothetical protein